MSITIQPTHPDFVAEISGVDLARSLAAADRDAIEDAINRYAVVVFRGQALTDEQQVAFARHFGPIQPAAQKARHTGVKHRLRGNDIADISNLDGDSRVLEANSKRRLDWLANRLWHTDASFRAVPGALSMLYAHVVPDDGGDTQFADLRAAYDALPETTRSQIEDLVAEHSIFHSRGQLSVTAYTPEELASLPPVPQRVVRRHAGSGRKTLYIASHASHVIGMPIADGRLLLMDLMEHATQPRFVHSHRWRVGDLVIWDNRCTMHRARPFDTTKVRDLRRVTTRDVASTLEQGASPRCNPAQLTASAPTSPETATASRSLHINSD
ncbi:MAG: TauD/TfdA dioxygenase family protein [Reyranella sp.]|uniref:TauD/TfdA dioxygenase family protein n=1 Tax=Reyranella sp. TaxID=1929291 RepID=UPI003D0BD5DD